MPKIIGTVLDKETGFPVGNTRIDLENEESYRTGTDSKGEFRIDVEPGEYEVSIHSTIFEDASVDVIVEDKDVEIVIESEKKRRFAKVK